MSLPNGFDTAYDYFQETIEFLRQNSWIYKEANTCFLNADILSKMPQEFKDYFTGIEYEELNQFPYVHQTLTNLKVQSLINFRQKLCQLIPNEAFQEPKDLNMEIKFENFKKINIKKQHEIQRLAKKVQETLQEQFWDDDDYIRGNGDEVNDDVDVNIKEKCILIDFGSGLGYLSEILYKLNKNQLILGLESDLYRVQAAEQRIKTYMPDASNFIQYRQQFITENSKEFIEQTIEQLFKSNYRKVPPNKMAIIGLHACADLTITSMKLFFQMSQVRHLIIMPCCYHKLQMYDDATFRNFPLSKSLQKVLLENDDNTNYAPEIQMTTYLNRPFLRLACQQTLKRWKKCTQEQHTTHGREMFLRAVAELIKLPVQEEDGDEEEDMELVVVKLKQGRNDLNLLNLEDEQSFDTFSRLYALKTKTSNECVPWSEYHKLKFAEIMKQYPNGCKLAEGLTCLQTSMQKLCENLVLYDRLCYMKETAESLNLNINVRYEKLMDEELSPRCYVLIAEKL